MRIIESRGSDAGYQRNKGFSLVELMIAVVLGAIIIGGIASIFLGVAKSSKLNEAVAHLQNNARVALDSMARDVRAAGFMGCATGDDATLNINAPNAPTSDFDATAITGYLVGNGSWLPSLPFGYSPPTTIGKPVEGTHALSVQFAEFPGLPMFSSMSSVLGNVSLESIDDIDLAARDLVVISDCSTAELFAPRSVSDNGSVVTVETSSPMSKLYTLDTDFPNGTRIMSFVSSIYYIGDTQRTNSSGDNISSLYVQHYPYNASNPPIELAEGVDQMILEFGIKQSDETVLFVNAEEYDVPNSDIVTVRVGLLLSSLDRFEDTDASRVYSLAGQSVGPNTLSAGNAFTYVSNDRFRMPFNATFNVRNNSN